MILNPKLCIRDTRRYGLGVFALTAIDKGEVVATFSGPTLSAQEVPPYPDPDCYMQIAPGWYIGPSGYEDDVINHSCEPNCEIKLGSLQLVAARLIAVSEEITYDYADVIYDDWEIPCLCGTSTCRGTIRSRRISIRHEN